MAISKQQLREALPQTNAQSPLATCWQQYFQYYQSSDLIERYRVSIDALTDGTVYQYFQLTQEHTQGDPQGTFVIVHGYMDHSGLYRHLIRFLLAHQWNVLIYDKLGHGVSSGSGYAITDFAQYAQQLHLVLSELKVRQNCDETGASALDNWCLLGQSTGAAVVMEYLLSKEFSANAKIAQIFLLSPLVRNREFRKTKTLLSVARLFLTKIKRSNSHSSHDQDFLRLINEQDPLAYHYIMLNWLLALVRWEKRFNYYQASALPATIIQGDDDATVDWRYNLPVIKSKFPNNSEQIIPRAKHNLVNESPVYRAQVFELLVTKKTTSA